MSTDEAPTFTERFESLELRLDMQSKLLNAIDAKIETLKKAQVAQLMTLAMLTGGRLALPPELAEALGIATSTLATPSIIRAS
jgi:hypothetical protein